MFILFFYGICSVRRGAHPAFDNLHRIYPIASERIFSRLQQVCSQLAHWSPVFGEVCTCMKSSNKFGYYYSF